MYHKELPREPHQPLYVEQRVVQQVPGGDVRLSLEKRALELSNRLGRKQAELIVKLQTHGIEPLEREKCVGDLEEIGNEISNFWRNNPGYVTEALAIILSASYMATVTRAEHSERLKNLLIQGLPDKIRVYLQNLISNLERIATTAEQKRPTSNTNPYATDFGKYPRSTGQKNY